MIDQRAIASTLTIPFLENSDKLVYPARTQSKWYYL